MASLYTFPSASVLNYTIFNRRWPLCFYCLQMTLSNGENVITKNQLDAERESQRDLLEALEDSEKSVSIVNFSMLLHLISPNKFIVCTCNEVRMPRPLQLA